MKATVYGIGICIAVVGVITSATSIAVPEDGGRFGRKRDPAKAFEKLDADGDGQVTLSEFTANAEERRARRKERRGDSEKSSNSNWTPPTPEEVFNLMDADDDGVLTLEEFSKALKNRRANKGRRGEGRRSRENEASGKVSDE